MNIPSNKACIEMDESKNIVVAAPLDGRAFTRWVNSFPLRRRNPLEGTAHEPPGRVAAAGHYCRRRQLEGLPCVSAWLCSLASDLAFLSVMYRVCIRSSFSRRLFSSLLFFPSQFSAFLLSLFKASSISCFEIPEDFSFF